MPRNIRTSPVPTATMLNGKERVLGLNRG